MDIVKEEIITLVEEDDTSACASTSQCNSNKLTIHNYGSHVDRHTSRQAINYRDSCISGFSRQQIIDRNIMIPSLNVQSFLYSYNFNPPTWLTDLVYRNKKKNKMLRNNFEYHSEANIDSICAHLFEDAVPAVMGAYHIRVNLCIFDRFASFVNANHDKVFLLCYMCMCDCFGIDHIHMIAISLLDMNYICAFFNTYTCDVQEQYTRIQDKVIKACLVPSMWPLHVHFSFSVISSEWVLFQTIESLCRHDLTSLKEETDILPPFVNSLKFIAGTGELTKQLETTFTDFVLKHFPFLTYPELENNGKGSHYHVFRPIIDNASLWFCALTSKGVSLYLNHKLENVSIVTKCNQVFNKRGKPSLLYGNLMEYLPVAAIPLQPGYHAYHDDCINNPPGQKFDSMMYLNLGQNMYIYISKSRCCGGLAPNLIINSCFTLLYFLNEDQLREYKSYLFWSNVNRKIETYHLSSMRKSITKTSK